MTDWFKKALLPAAGAALAVPILADESEAASFPKDAVVKHLKKIAGPEFSKIPQESIDNVLKWSTHDVPKSFGLDKPATNQADRNLLETALNSPFVYSLNPKDFNNLRLAQSVFPEEAIGKINPSFEFLDPQSGSLGSYIFNDKTGKSTIYYNPVKAKSTTPPHELTHGVQDVPSFRAEFNRPTNLNLDAMEKTTNDYKNLIEGAPFKLSQLTPEYIKSIPEHIDLIKALKESYKHNPAETMARDVADYFEGGLLNKDYQGLKNYSNFKDVFSDSAKTAFEDYKKKFPQRGYEIAREVVDEAIKSGKYKHLSKAALATPFAVAGTQLINEDDAESGPVKISNLWRGSDSTVEKIGADGVKRLQYNLADRPAYRTIDNPMGANQFGDIYPIELNMSNLFDARQDPEMVLRVAKKAEEMYGRNFDETVKQMLTGNWDAYESGEKNKIGQLGDIQSLLKRYGYSGNWQVEPTKFQYGDIEALRPFLNRKYQDVFTTFDKNELSIGDMWKRRGELEPLIRNAELKTRPRYRGGEEMPIREARKKIEHLIDPNVLYNGEPLQSFHPNWKPLLEEFRPDAYQLTEKYENKHLFPPSREAFSRKDIRDKYNITGAALATPFAFVETSHASTPNQEKSIFDGLVNDDGIYNAVKRVEGEKALSTPNGIWELAKLLPGAVAPAIPAVRQMISGFVGDEVKKIGKSAKKLVSLKEGDKADWEDYANILQLADKPGLLMMGHDIAKGIGEPVGKRIAEGINDFYESNRVASEFFDGQ